MVKEFESVLLMTFVYVYKIDNTNLISGELEEKEYRDVESDERVLTIQTNNEPIVIDLNKRKYEWHYHVRSGYRLQLHSCSFKKTNDVWYLVHMHV